jgi:hypothetical protein
MKQGISLGTVHVRKLNAEEVLINYDIQQIRAKIPKDVKKAAWVITEKGEVRIGNYQFNKETGKFEKILNLAEKVLKILRSILNIFAKKNK